MRSFYEEASWNVDSTRNFDYYDQTVAFVG